MYGLAYVLVPAEFTSLQAELDRALAPFQRGGDERFPRDKLAFDDATEALLRLHNRRVHYDAGKLTWRDHRREPDFAGSFYLDLAKLSEHMAACRLTMFEGTFAEIEPDFDAFVRRFTQFSARDPATSRYGRWLNPIGTWDWWELGGRFNGAILGERRPAGAEPAISSGPNPGRAILGNIVAAFGGSLSDERSQIELNVELVQSLKDAIGDAPRRLPTALVLPVGACADADRWFDGLGWHAIRPGTRTALAAPPDADFRALVHAAYRKFHSCAAAGVAYHF